MSLDPGTEFKIRKAFAAQNFMSSIGASITAIAAQHVTLSAPIKDAYLQHNGIAHAALTFALGDTAAGFAAATLMPEDGNVMTTEMKINLLAPASGTRLRAEGRVIKPGKRLIVVQADVFAESDGQDPVHVAILMGTMVSAHPKK